MEVFHMDATNRYISKIARAAQRCAAHSLADLGVGPTERECLVRVRRNPGTSQMYLSEQLNIDRAAVARMLANLEKKGLVIREPDENDKRANKVYVTDLAQEIIQSDLGGESMFYEWLTDGMEEEELARFADTLSRLAQKARNERMAQFVNFTKWAQDHREEV